MHQAWKAGFYIEPSGRISSDRVQDLCRYDAEPTRYETTPSNLSASGFSEKSPEKCLSALPNAPFTSELQGKIRDFGYSNQGSLNSFSLLRTSELYSGQDNASDVATYNGQPPYDQGADRRYRELVRQLPSQSCVDILVSTFFSDVNWQYDMLHEGLFRGQLQQWRNVSYSNLQDGLSALPGATLVVPALLFEVLAQALLFHPPHDQRIHHLLPIPGMGFHDLAAEYSDAGADILELLGKRNLTIATVQAGLLRAACLKSRGKVIEAWHALGATIRDAQEIGLHTGQFLYGDSSIPPGEERTALSAIGHKIWVVLHIWDVHMAVVLSRPIATELQIGRFARTITYDETRRYLFAHWQTESEPPRPFDVILAGYNVAYRYFQDIRQLEQNGARLQDYATVDRIHTAIMKNLKSLPSWCRLVDPNTKFDSKTGCQWLQIAREGLSSLIHLVILTLHRPFIFSVEASRAGALKAGIAILQGQDRLFQNIDPYQCRVFNPVYASFDAIVLISAICISFPDHIQEHRTECIEVVQRGVDRLDAIGQSNDMAKKAHGVVSSLYRRMKHRLGISNPANDIGNLVSDSDLISPEDATPLNGAMPEPSFDAIPPPRPTYDLFYDHLSSAPMSFIGPQPTLPLNAPNMHGMPTWNFEGIFPEDSFWSVMNDLNQ